MTSRLRIALVSGLCAAAFVYSSGTSAWWSVLAGLIAAGLVWALAALL